MVLGEEGMDVGDTAGIRFVEGTEGPRDLFPFEYRTQLGKMSGMRE